jgi:hypothetical protein
VKHLSETSNVQSIYYALADEGVTMADWPTEKLHNVIGKPYCTTTEQIRIWLAPDVMDVTHDPEVQGQLRRYAPDIHQLGVGLYRERYGMRNIWGGLLVRGLETKSAESQADDSLRRCLQYIFIWTKQQSVVSAFWMVIVPLLMGLWGLFVRELYAPLIVTLQQQLQLDFWGTLLTLSDLSLPILATGFVSLPLLFSGIWDHRWDLQLGSGFTFRSTTLLIPFSILMWFVAFSWIVPVIILAFTIFVCFFYWLLDQIGFVGTSHHMDYLPVFVWLKFNELEGWKFEKAYWDRHHYSIECKEADELTKPRYPLLTPNLARRKTEDDETEERIRLQMDNPWHSVRPGGSVRRLFLFLSVIGLIVFIPVALLLYYSGQYAEFYYGGIAFVLSCTLVVLAFRTIMRTSSKLMPDDELRDLKLPSSVEELNLFSEKTKNHLNETRLQILWNLVKTEDTGHWILKKLRSIRRGAEEFQPDIRPRLVVITKLQDPFNFYGLSRYYESFRDDSDYLYLYISTRCPMTDADRDRSLESKIEFQKEGIQMDPTAQVRFEVAQRSFTDQEDPVSFAQDLIRELDDKKRRVTKEQIEEFLQKRK